MKAMGQHQETSVNSARPDVIAVGPMPGPGQPAPAMANPLSDDSAALQEGRRLFVSFNCAGCHGGRAGGGMGPSLRDTDWIYGKTDAQIFDSIAAGRAHGMPSWGSRLPEHEIWKLVTYIDSLGTDLEPDKPH
jgi:cytochrome c oxidase cbb3-type subunit 3